jgi:hypothetical protein
MTHKKGTRAHLCNSSGLEEMGVDFQRVSDEFRAPVLGDDGKAGGPFVAPMNPFNPHLVVGRFLNGGGLNGGLKARLRTPRAVMEENN